MATTRDPITGAIIEDSVKTTNPITGLEETSSAVNPTGSFGDPLIDMTKPEKPVSDIGTDINTPEPTGENVIKETPIVPKTTSKDDLVAEGGKFEGEGTKTSTSLLEDINSTQDLSDIVSGGGDNATDILKEINKRKQIQTITGVSDKFLEKLGMGIKGEASATTASTEAALDLADRLLGGEFANIGLAPGQEMSNSRVTEVLSDQGFTDVEIKAALAARDNILNKKRLSGDKQTIIEEKEAEIRQRNEREKQSILEQVTRQQNLLQRQRSLRGTGRSSITEGDMLDLQKKGEQIIAEAQSKANSELALFKAKAEGAEGEVIAALEKSLNEKVKGLNDAVLAQVDAENKLIAQGKTDQQQGWESLMSSLSLTGEDVGVIDKNSSELVGYVADKFGSAILVDGKKVPIGGNTAANAETISNYAQGMISGDVTLGAIPQDLRDNVINAWALMRGKSGNKLTSQQMADASILSQKLFNSTKDNEVAAIESLMMMGLTNEEIIDRANTMGFSEKYTGSIRDGFEQASGALSQAQFEKYQSTINRFIDEGKGSKALDFLLATAREGASAQQQDKITGLGELVNNVLRIKDTLKNFEAKGGDTNKITWVIEAGNKLIGKTSDPELSQMAAEIGMAIQAYRQSRSGAAFSESEAKEYDALFPGIGKDFDLNESLMSGVLNVAETAKNNFYSEKIGRTNFSEIFPTGVMGFEHPGYGFNETTIILNPEGTGDDIYNQLTGSSGEAGQKLSIKSDVTEKTNFLDEGESDFNSGDQTSGSKGTSETGFQEKMNVARTGTNVAKDTNNPGNITADSIPSGFTKEKYGEQIGATGTYLSPNGREYFVFPDVDSGTQALKRDITAKITGGSANIKPTDTLERFQRVYVGEVSSGYLSVLTRITGMDKNTPISEIDPELLTRAVMEAEGFI